MSCDVFDDISNTYAFIKSYERTARCITPTYDIKKNNATPVKIYHGVLLIDPTKFKIPRPRTPFNVSPDDIYRM